MSIEGTTVDGSRQKLEVALGADSGRGEPQVLRQRGCEVQLTAVINDCISTQLRPGNVEEYAVFDRNVAI